MASGQRDISGDRAETQSPLKAAVAHSRRIFVLAGIFGLFINLLMLTGPLYMLQVYDRVLMSESIPTLVALTLLVAALYITLGILDWLRNVIFVDTGSRFEETLARPAFEAVIQANLKDPGRPNERALSSLRSLRKFYAGQALPALFDLPFSPLFFLVLFMMHWAYGAWALFGALALLAIAFINRQVSSKSVRRAEELERASHNQTAEITRNVEVMEAMGMRAPLAARWQGLLDNSDAAIRESSGAIGVFSAGTKVFRLFLQSAILGLGAYLSIIGQSTPGAMIAASILMGRAIGPIQQVVSQWRTIVNAASAWTHLRQTLEKLESPEQGMRLPPIRGELSFQGVYAGPPGTDANTLRLISFELEPGDSLGLLGPSASGKSSLARVMIGLWPARHGVVRLDGADIRGLSRDLLGPQIGYLPQQVDLFTGTVMENISRFSPQADPETVLAASAAADCHDMILQLPEGYDTQVGAAGCYLSAGQRQRIGLARALYGAPNFVVLDEPNSNLDGAGDQALLNAIAGLRARKATSVIIAHRPNAIVHCNKLMVLENGEVKAFGPREELLPRIMPKSAIASPAPKAATGPRKAQGGKGE